ncbi:MAG: U32 family peptidase [Ignavibacteriales bacterium]|nr:U32 family peptidase [Ignavibacteriales bacterium]
MQDRRKPELAAPAGDWSMLNAVIKNGANAIYFGIEDLNMRVMAENFTEQDLPKITEICREHGVETHLVVNTILYDGELKRAESIIKLASECGINLIVCWDLAAIQLCKKYSMPFCISTQASVSNSLSAEIYKDMGARRIVLARECSLEQIKEIKEHVQIEIEAFIHGAMCIAVSGRCFMSHEVFGRSANRGDCLQSCRREYEIYDVRKDASLLIGKDYVMSSKDLNTILFLDTLIESGIDAFKIEGRKRSPEYAAKVTSVYRRAIDAYFAGALDENAKIAFNTELSEVYNRGFTSGFYMEQPGAEGFAEHEGNASVIKKELLGKVVNYYPQKQICHLQIQTNHLDAGDRLLIIGSTSGVIELEINEMRVNDAPGDTAKKGDFVTFTCQEKVRPGDKAYRLIHKPEIQSYAPLPK